MILYNVTVKVLPDVHEDWLIWMREIHIPEVMKTGMFEDFRICHILQEEEDGITYAIQYFCKDLATFERYRTEFSPGLQAAHAERYQGQYVAFRTLMEIL